MSDAATLKMPASPEAEKNIVSYLMQENSVIPDIEGIITQDDFYSPEYGLIYACLLELYNSKSEISIPLIQDLLKKKAAPPNAYDSHYLNDLYMSAPYAVNPIEIANLVREKSMLRMVIKQNREIEKLCYEESLDLEEVLERTEQNVKTVRDRHGASTAKNIKDIVSETLESIQDAFENPGSITGIPTGFNDLDKITAGLHGSELTLIAARPAMGKTAFALTIASHVAFKHNYPVVLFSLEMGEKQLMKRLLSMDSGIDSENLRDGKLSDMDWVPLMESADRISNSNLIIDEANGITLSEIRSRCRHYYKQNNIQLVVIDYLQLINGNGKNIGRQQEIADISRGLKSLARELDIPVIALAQLNRETEKREDKKPMLSDLRDSGSIEQDADVVLLLYRESYYNQEANTNKSKVIIAKHRNGKTGEIELAWIDKYAKFGNLANAWNRMTPQD